MAFPETKLSYIAPAMKPFTVAQMEVLTRFNHSVYNVCEISLHDYLDLVGKMWEVGVIKQDEAHWLISVCKGYGTQAANWANRLKHHLNNPGLTQTATRAVLRMMFILSVLGSLD